MVGYAALMVSGIQYHQRLEQEVGLQTLGLRRRPEELLIFHNIAQVLSSSFDLQQVLNGTLDEVLKATGMEMGLIALLDERAQELYFPVWRRVSEEFISQMGRLKVGEGITGKVAQFGQPIWVEEEVQRDKRVSRRRLVQAEGWSALIAVPPRSKGKVVGVMDLVSRSPRRFTPHEVDLLTTLGNQIGVTVENIPLYQEVRRRGEMITVLNTLQAKVSQASGFDEAVRRLLTELINQMAFDSTWIYLVEQDKDRFSLFGYEGISPDSLGYPLKLRKREGLLGTVADGRKPLLIEDTGIVPLNWGGKERLGSFVAIPLIGKEMPMGVLCGGKIEPKMFRSENLQFFIALGNQLGLALENIRLY